MSFSNVKDTVLHLYETTGKIIVLCIYYLYFFFNGEAQNSLSNGRRHFLNLMCS